MCHQARGDWSGGTHSHHLPRKFHHSGEHKPSRGHQTSRCSRASGTTSSSCHNPQISLCTAHLAEKQKVKADALSWKLKTPGNALSCQWVNFIFGLFDTPHVDMFASSRGQAFPCMPSHCWSPPETALGHQGQLSPDRPELGANCGFISCRHYSGSRPALLHG